MVVQRCVYSEGGGALPGDSSEWIQSGPEWNPDVLPIKYAGAMVRWSKTHFDSVVIPLIVTVKHVFWDLRLTEFEVSDHHLKIVVGLPSIHGAEQGFVSFGDGDVAPGEIAGKMANVLVCVGSEVLSEEWQYTIVFQQGERSMRYEGAMSGGE